jgi:hypothetical protein
MRVENTASKNYNDVVKAREFAKAAMDQAVAQIREATTRNVPPANILNYVTFPGVAYYSDGTTTTRQPLYSDNLNSQFDFNADLWVTDKIGEFAGLGAVMDKVGWIYVADDGTLAPPNPYPMPINKSIIGRIAFWVDDEASKININTAGLGAVPADLTFNSTPKELNLGELLPSPFLNAADIQNGSPTYPRGTYPYSTIEEVMRGKAVGITPTVFNENRFSITAYSDDRDDLDALGDKRSDLDITALTEAKDITDIVGPKSTYARLADNTKLPKVYSAARAFANKYPIVGGLDGLKQIIANIIAYQLNPRLAADLAKLPDASGDPPAYLGLIRAPYVNEVKVNYDTTVAGEITRTITIELFYPYGADGSAYLAGVADTIEIKNLPSVGALALNYAASPPPGLAGKSFSSATGIYFTFQIVDKDPAFAPSGPVAVLATTVTVNYYRTAKRLDCAQVPLPNVGIPVSGVSWHGAEVNDPCVNENTAEWTPYRNPTAGTPGPPGLSAAGQNSVYAPGGNLSKTIIRGSAMLSVGELGYIHLPVTASSPNSWQHLRLQPQPASEKAPIRQIPDWAMLDMFTVPNAKTGGRININSYINPALAIPAPATQRLVPLKSLLSVLIPTPSLQLQTLAGNIYGNINGGIYVNSPDGFGIVGAYDSIGEICEVLGMDNGAAVNEADKEAIIRRIADLITVRSNTFTIWIIAQSVKEPTGAAGQVVGTFQAGTDLITGEVRAQVVVERYETAPGAAGNTVKFRVRYFRYL